MPRIVLPAPFVMRILAMKKSRHLLFLSKCERISNERGETETTRTKEEKLKQHGFQKYTNDYHMY